eukprot:scaffold81342_cov61-Phaeocystis_antarctica.AAC.2
MVLSPRSAAERRSRAAFIPCCAMVSALFTSATPTGAFAASSCSELTSAAQGVGGTSGAALLHAS